MEGVGAKGRLRRKEERAAVEVGEFEVRFAREDGFHSVGLCCLDAQVNIDVPAAGIN
jgi:hypothetical protein